ncbi:phage tail tape measure protein [Bradyrhizobium sp. 186]|uniref:phage tail tape measure protein n=1 Tax=Bradyrhizobium sp. 186 TaxID=2782654 RepID=UPI002000BF10|nr:phage tail tape measure protein [Bradyrhizobium sp. 186]UPK32148.1 phage tail tape measure protein [Bradyrhizobium sp. 186]
MSEIISVHASLTASDTASPVIAGLLKNVRKLEAAIKSINGVSESKLFPDSLSAGLQKATDDARKAAASYRSEWKTAYDARLRDARTFHRELDRLDRQTFNRQQAEQRGVDRGARSASRGKSPRGISSTTALIAGGITISGVASAFKKRMEANVAETKAQIFGGLSPDEVKKLRGDWSDQVAIRFGESAAAVLDGYTEALKQGFDGSAAKKITENALEASSALEMNIGELMKLAGKTATGLYGNVRNADPARVARMMTSVAVAAAATAADPNEVVEANKRALSALSTTKMKETDLSAFTSVGISAGLQPNKAGTFLGYLTSEFANAGNARGQRAKDLDQAARMIGYGGRAQMAQRMAAAPTEFMLDMFSKMRNMSEQTRAKFANLAGMREWRDELVQMAKASDQIRETLKEIDQKSDAVSAFSRTKLNSLQKRWDRIKAMFGLAWEKFGSGFEQSFIEVSDWFDRHTSIVTSGKIGEKSREFVERLKKAFGVANIGEALDKIAAKISSIDVDRIIGFASGFVGGLKSISDTVLTMLKGVATAMGKDGNSAEVLGKLAGQIVGLSVALGLLAPVIAVLSGFATIISRIAGLLTGRALLGAASANPVGTTALLAWLLAENNDAGIPDSAKKRPGETTSQWRERQRQHKKDLYQKQSGEGFDPANVHRSSYLTDSFDKLGGKIERASLTSTDFSARSRGGLSGGTAVATNMNRLVSGVGTPDALWKNVTPGGILPNFGIGSSGIIKRSNIPSFNGGGGSVDDMSRAAFDKKFAGTALAGKYDQVVATARANGISPALLAGVIAHETGNGHVLSGNNVAGLMDPATGMAKKMQFASLDAGISRAGQVVAKNYRLAGGNLDKMGERYAPVGAANDPRRLNGGWPAGVRKQMNALSGGGSAGSGDAVAWAEKYKGLNEYTDNRVLAAVLGGDVRGKSNAWCARFVNKALEAAGGNGTGSAVANSFQKWGSAVSPPDVKRNDVLLQTNGYGYNKPGGHVGLATGETRMHNGRLQIKMLAGNDGDAVREHWIDADKNLMVRRGNPIGQVPSAVDAVKNVPAAPQSGVPMRGALVVASAALSRSTSTAIAMIRKRSQLWSSAALTSR